MWILHKDFCLVFFILFSHYDKNGGTHVLGTAVRSLHLFLAGKQGESARGSYDIAIAELDELNFGSFVIFHIFSVSPYRYGYLFYFTISGVA